MGVFQNITLHRPTNSAESQTKLGVSLGVRTCELFLCFVVIVRVRAIMLTSLFSLFYDTGEFHRFLHRGRAKIRLAYHFVERNNMIKRVIEVPGKVFNPTPLIMGICGWARELLHLVKI